MHCEVDFLEGRSIGLKGNFKNCFLTWSWRRNWWDRRVVFNGKGGWRG